MITERQLRELYIDKGLTLRQVAFKLKLPTHGCLPRYMKKYGIEGRASGFQKGNQINKDRKPENCPGWKGGKVKVECSYCGNIIEKFPSLVNDKNFCNLDCRGKWRSENMRGKDNPNYDNHVLSGESNPNWKGGITCQEYCGAWLDREFKEDIKERDGYACQNDDCKGRGSILTVHHIDYDKKNCKPNNLITLCNSCNARANFDRNFWETKYSKIVNF